MIQTGQPYWFLILVNNFLKRVYWQYVLMKLTLIHFLKAIYICTVTFPPDKWMVINVDGIRSLEWKWYLNLGRKYKEKYFIPVGLDKYSNFKVQSTFYGCPFHETNSNINPESSTNACIYASWEVAFFCVISQTP